MRSEGWRKWRWRSWSLSFSWGESVKAMTRTAEVWIDREGDLPRPRLRVRVGTMPKRWLPPHDTTIHVSFGRNRWVSFDLVIGGPRFRKGA